MGLIVGGENRLTSGDEGKRVHKCKQAVCKCKGEQTKPKGQLVVGR